MKHVASPSFWKGYYKLAKDVRVLADQKFILLKTNPRHPSLHFKKIEKYRSVRVSIKHRALAIEHESKLIWFWIGTHADYDEILK